MKPYYDHAGITLYHGDCREVFDSAWKANRVITDPPYGFGSYTTDDDSSVVGMLINLRVLADTMAVFGYPENLVSWCAKTGITPDEWITWWPTNKTIARGSNRSLPRESECIAVFGEMASTEQIRRPRASEGAKIAKRVGRRGLSADEVTARAGDVWIDSAPGMMFNSHLRLHPNEKPVELMKRLVVLCSPSADDVVLDPYSGSGTTMVAAKILGRRAIGIEIEEKYCEIAAKRLSQEVLPLGAA